MFFSQPSQIPGLTVGANRPIIFCNKSLLAAQSTIALQADGRTGGYVTSTEERFLRNTR